MRTNQLVIIIILLATVLISANSGGLYIYALDEAKNASCAREMLEKRDFVVPTFNYNLRGDKPPLHYYFMMAAYSLFGVNEFSARFFSVVMGVLTILAVFLFTNRFINRNAAFFAVLALLSSLHFVLQFHMAVPDPYLIFFMTLGMIFIFLSIQNPSWKNILVMYASFGLATLAKGPVAVALPGLSFLVYLILSGKFSFGFIARLKPLAGLLIYLLVTLPWFILVHIKTHGEWTRIFFVEHNFDRYTSTMEGHGAFFLVTPLIVIFGLLPFSIVMIQSVVAAWKKRKENDLLLFCLAYAITVIVFFSISRTKLPNYTVPAYPFLAILAGWYIDKLLTGTAGRPFLRLSVWIYLVISAILPVVFFEVLGNDPLLSHLRSISWYFLLLPAGGVITLVLIYKKKLLAAFTTLSLSWIVMTLLFFYLLFPRIDRENPVARALPLMDTSRPIAVYGIYNSAFSFYIRKPLTPVTNIKELGAYINTHRHAYIISRKSKTEDLVRFKNLRLVTEVKDIFETPITVIYQVE